MAVVNSALISGLWALSFVPLSRAALRKAIMAIWCVCFCGMQWRTIGRLSGILFGTL